MVFYFLNKKTSLAFLSGKRIIAKNAGSTATLQKVWIFPTLAYFHPKGGLTVFSTRGCFAGFFIGLPCVDPTLCLQFGTSSRLGNIGNLDSCSS